MGKKGNIFHRRQGEDVAEFVLNSYDEMMESDIYFKRNPYMYSLPSGLQGGYQHYFEVRGGLSSATEEGRVLETKTQVQSKEADSREGR